MILLDTNVISEVMKPAPHPAATEWLDAQVAGTLFLSSITLAEIRFGVHVLPVGKRRTHLIELLEEIQGLFADRILPFDAAAATCYADLAIRARAAGLGFPTPDGYIAAIAAARGFQVASRDASAFVAAGLKVIDPWQGPG